MKINTENLIFYTPEKQYPGMPHGEMCGDIMPFFWEGRYIFLYLYKYCIYAVETKDFVHYDEHRLVLQNGTPDEQDWHAATGSVIYANGRFVFYYTGFCEGNRQKPGKHEQAILRAFSDDLINWEKDKDFLFLPDERFYGGVHWRDPHVFFSDELKKYCMLVTCTAKDGLALRSGCTALYVSEDVLVWEHYKTIYAPETYVTHECQDTFKIGNRWYLTFSNYNRWWETRYRISDSLLGKWEEPRFDDMFDGREFYAAKTVSNGLRRFIVGWQSIRKDCSDQGKFVWGGNAVVHELKQRNDGTLGVAMPQTIYDSFSESLPVKQSLYIDAQNLFKHELVGEMTSVCLFEGDLEWTEGTHTVGLMIHAEGDKLEKWCQLRIELGHERIRMERFNQIDGDQFYLDERPFSASGNKVHVQVITSGNVILTYVDDIALTTRCYEAGIGSIGVFAEYGSLNATNLKLKGQPNQGV